MSWTGWCRRTIVKLSWFRFGQGDQLLDGSRRHRWIHGKNVNLSRYQRDWPKIRHCIVRHFPQQLQDPKCTAGDSQVITVGRRFGHDFSLKKTFGDSQWWGALGVQG